jgi:hypothetical protein
MVRNRRLAQGLAEQSLGRVRQRLGEKTTWRGGRLLAADRLSPSSTTCSADGTMSVTLTWPSAGGEGCDLVIDRRWAPPETCSGLPSGAEGPVEPREGPALLGGGDGAEPGTARGPTGVIPWASLRRRGGPGPSPGLLAMVDQGLTYGPWLATA